MYRLGLLGLLGGCDLVFELNEPSGARVRTLSIQQPTSMTLKDFPVSIVFADDASLAETAAPDGSDIVFHADGVELSAEVLYDGDTGSLDAWVKLPSVGADPIQLRLEYGTGQQRTFAPRSTWSASFAGVWHMSAQGKTETDSATLGLDVDAAPGQEPASVSGIAGAARSFDGDDDSMCAINTTDLEFGMESFSYGLWVFVTDPVGLFDRPLAKGGGGNDNAGFNFELGIGGGNANVSDGQSNLARGFALPRNEWVHLTARVDRANKQFSMFVNGFEIAGNDVIPDVFGDTSATDPLCFGDARQQFRGMLDEVRIYRDVQPVEWYRAETANLAQRDEFVKVVSDEPFEPAM